MFPELRATVQHLHENRRLWNEMYLADIEADTFKTRAEKIAEKVTLQSYSCCKLQRAADLGNLVDTTGPEHHQISQLCLCSCALVCSMV